MIAEALGIRGQPGKTALEGLVDALALQDVLIVLDNCEHLIAAARRRPRRSCGGARGCICWPPAASRWASAARPSTGCRRCRCPGPERARLRQSCEAVALFVERAQAQGVSLSRGRARPARCWCRSAVAWTGCRWRIELAAARLRSLPLRGLRDRLDQRFRLLTGGSRTALARQQTLRATVDWSYSLLNRRRTGAAAAAVGVRRRLRPGRG